MVTPLQLSNQEEGPAYAIVELLLLHKANPNKGIYVYENKTPWELYLGACYSHLANNKSSSISTELGNVMTLLLNHGADPDLKIQPGDSSEPLVSVPETIQRLSLSTRQTDALERLILEKRAENQASFWDLVLWLSWR
jgi:hypothetical protein